MVNVEEPLSNNQWGKAPDVSMGMEQKNRNTQDNESIPGTSHQSVTRLRDGECIAKDCRVLITGCGRSGTHFFAEQLAGAGISKHYSGRLPPIRPCSQCFATVQYPSYVLGVQPHQHAQTQTLESMWYGRHRHHNHHTSVFSPSA